MNVVLPAMLVDAVHTGIGAGGTLLPPNNQRRRTCTQQRTGRTPGRVELHGAQALVHLFGQGWAHDLIDDPEQ